MLSAIQAGASNLISIGYDPMGRRRLLARRDGSTATYGYDGASRLTRLSDDFGSAGDLAIELSYNPASGGSTLAFAHDARGNRLNDEARAYTYDSVTRGRGTATGRSAQAPRPKR